MRHNAIPPATWATGPQPTISGTVCLHPWRMTDVGFIAEAFADPDISFWHAHAADDPSVWVAKMEQRWHHKEGGDWLVESAGKPCGRVGIHHLDLASGTAEIGYWVHPTHRGLGIATQAVSTMTVWLFDNGIHRVELYHSTRNASSCAVASKCHYELEGTHRSAVLHADGWHDMHVHARINPNHLEKP